jgi:hypothetical protein
MYLKSVMLSEMNKTDKSILYNSIIKMSRKCALKHCVTLCISGLLAMQREGDRGRKTEHPRGTRKCWGTCVLVNSILD